MPTSDNQCFQVKFVATERSTERLSATGKMGSIHEEGLGSSEKVATLVQELTAVSIPKEF